MNQNKIQIKNGKIIQLILNGLPIIEGNDSEDYLGNGCYLMYPWVNRLSDQNVKSVFRDSNGYPLHGLYSNKERKIVSQKDDEIVLQLLNEKGDAILQERYSFINEKQFIIESHILDSEAQYGIGYHPYFSFSNIDDVILVSNLTKKLKVNEHLIPIGDQLEWEEVNLQKLQLKDQFFDSCFTSDEESIFIKLINEKYTLHLQFHNYQYCQIYTPPDRKRIAIEPQSSTADCFKFNTQKQGKQIFKFTITIE